MQPINEPMTSGERPLWSPYLAGFLLGLVLLASFLVLGEGLGASGGFGRVGLFFMSLAAPEHIRGLEHANALFSTEWHFLKDGLVFLAIGVAVGGFVSALMGRRVKPFGTVERGPTSSSHRRLILALVGGILMGFAARLARGCTSGQALSGGAMLALGSWAFMLSVFAGGFAFAWFVRRQYQ